MVARGAPRLALLETLLLGQGSIQVQSRARPRPLFFQAKLPGTFKNSLENIDERVHVASLCA